MSATEELIDPDTVLAYAADGDTPAARINRNVYYRAAFDAHLETKLPEAMISQLYHYLWSFAKDRFIAGKSTHRDHLHQEAVRVAKQTSQYPHATTLCIWAEQL